MDAAAGSGPDQRPHPGPDGCPEPEGARRIAVVTGSSLVRSPFSGGREVIVEVPGRDGAPVDVRLLDHGGFVALDRHGVAGRVPAHLVDHHAHVRALVEIGCDRVLAVGSSGSLRRDWPVGTLVAPDDFLALTTYDTFHDTTDGYALRGFDRPWRDEVLRAWSSVAACSTAALPTARSDGARTLRDGATYAQVRGPRFETRAEIRLLSNFADLVGMTLASECMLASEAGLRYAAVCQIDNLANGLIPPGTATAPSAVSAVDAYLDTARALHGTLADEVVAAVEVLTAPVAATGPNRPEGPRA